MYREDSSSGSEQPRDDELVARYRIGDNAAASQLFRRYYARLVRLARQNMGRALLEKEDPSDVAMSVFESVFLEHEQRQIIMGRDGSIWPLLATATLNKIRSRGRYWKRERRNPQHEQPLEDRDPLETGPGPEDLAALNEIIEQVKKKLGAGREEIVEYLLQGMQESEIARRVGVTKTTVQRTRRYLFRLVIEELRDGQPPDGSE